MAVTATADASFPDHIRLACAASLGGAVRRRLLDHFGSPQAVFAASVADLRAVAGIGHKAATAITKAAADPDVERLASICAQRGVDMLIEGATDYPRLLSQIDDPPGVLFVRGRLEPCDSMAVAIVGARHATAYGRRVAWQLAGGLARAGYTVVSGLARGIDAAAHRGALDAGGRTIAVLGTGVLEIYPPEHAELALEIVARGAVVSEAPPFTTARRGVFPRRNRIVSGLSLGTVVVEAAEHSGALITARLAGEQGREVFAVPGAIDCRMARGCHRLIRDGARLVESVDDILAELGPLFEPTVAADGRRIHAPAELLLDDIERRVLDTVDSGTGTDIDGLVAASGLATSQVLATIGVLEMRRLVRRLPGNRVTRP